VRRYSVVVVVGEKAEIKYGRKRRTGGGRDGWKRLEADGYRKGRVSSAAREEKASGRSSFG
jgi:hypothetical protein